MAAIRSPAPELCRLERRDLRAVRRGPAADRLADLLRGAVALALSASDSAWRRRRVASTSSARSTIDGSSPLSIAPRRMTSGSSRSRCSPTLMRLLPLLLRPPLAAAAGPRRGRGSRAASRHGARSSVRGTRGRSRRTPACRRGHVHSRPRRSRPARRRRRSALRAHRIGQRAQIGPLLGVEVAGGGGQASAGPRRSPTRAHTPSSQRRTAPSRSSSSDRSCSVSGAPFSASTRATTSTPGTCTSSARCPNGGRYAAASASTSAAGSQQRVGEDRRIAGRQVALDLLAGRRPREPVELVELARDRIGALGHELDDALRAMADEQEADLLRRQDLGDRVRRGAQSLGRRHLPAADVEELVGHVARRLALEDLARDGIAPVAGAAARGEVLAARLDGHAEQRPLRRPLEVPGQLRGALQRRDPAASSHSPGPTSRGRACRRPPPSRHPSPWRTSCRPGHSSGR